MPKKTGLFIVATCAVVASAFGGTDSQCMIDCNARNYQYKYCESVCALPDKGGSTRSQSGFVHRSMYDAASAGRRDAQEERKRQLENDLLAEELRRARAQSASVTTDQAVAREPAPGAATPSSSVPKNEQLLLEKFQTAIRYRRYRWKDFDEVVFAQDLKISMDMVGLMAESPNAADIAYYLGTHKEEAASISKMSLPAAAQEIFAIEAKIQTPSKDDTR